MNPNINSSRIEAKIEMCFQSRKPELICSHQPFTSGSVPWCSNGAPVYGKGWGLEGSMGGVPGMRFTLSDWELSSPQGAGLAVSFELFYSGQFARGIVFLESE